MMLSAHRDRWPAALPSLVRLTVRAWRAWRVAYLGAALVATTLAADDDTIISPRSTARDDAPAASTTAGSFNSLSLVVAVALAGVGGWMVWRNRRSTTGGRDLRALSVDETRSLGNRQYLVVASYEGKKFLLGVCPGRIDMLSPLGEASSAVAPARSRE